MNKCIKWTKAIVVAMINMCLLCGAGHVLDWLGFTTRRIKRVILSRL